MDERDEQQPEGLLKARAANMGRPHRRRQRPAEPVAAFQPLRQSPDPEHAEPPTRQCGDCGTHIQEHRLRAMPSAIRCLECQRAFELARAGS
jgi:hypothetical protein